MEAPRGWANIQKPPGAGGVCGRGHGVYDGRVCPECNRTRKMAALRQATWEATEVADDDTIREYVNEVLREVESDAP